MRLLHHIVNKIFFLKIGRLDLISQRDMYLMYHIILEKPTNLSEMIMSYMVDHMKRKIGSLPYGMLLTEIFEDAQIEVSNEVFQKLLHSDPYNKNSLKRMDYVKIEDNGYVKNHKLAPLILLRKNLRRIGHT